MQPTIVVFSFISLFTSDRLVVVITASNRARSSKLKIPVRSFPLSMKRCFKSTNNSVFIMYENKMPKHLFCSLHNLLCNRTSSIDLSDFDIFTFMFFDCLIGTPFRLPTCCLTVSDSNQACPPWLNGSAAAFH